MVTLLGCTYSIHEKLCEFGHKVLSDCTQTGAEEYSNDVGPITQGHLIPDC